VIHQSQKPSAWLTDPHHTIVDIDLVSHLVELANTHNVSGELGNVVNTGGGSMLRNTYSEHQNAPRFHQQRSLVKAKLATRKSLRKPKLHSGA
jgi:hypothetical protein